MILVSGNINLETTVRVPAFPLEYQNTHFPFFGIDSAVSGVGFNVGRALRKLGRPVRLVSAIGPDRLGNLIRKALLEEGFDLSGVIDAAAATAQSVVLYDGDGRRQIHTDLKDLQELIFPETVFAKALDGVRLAVMSTINYNRPLLARVREAGIPLAVDVQAIGGVDDGYNRDFMAAADILFCSHERLPERPEVTAGALLGRYPARLVAMGLGAEGALLAVRGERMRRIPAAAGRPIVSTVGAGDALFAAFLDGYLGELSPADALSRAVLFARHKIGERGGAAGFLSGAELDARWEGARCESG